MAGGGRKKKKWKNKTLYICTAEYKNNFETRYAIHSINLRDLLSWEEEMRADETKGAHSANSTGCGVLQNVDSITSNLIPRGNALVLDLEDGTNILFSRQFSYWYILRHHHEIDQGIVPYHMTINDSDSRISIKPIKTKALGREVVPPVFWSPGTSHTFVHLGGRKVCCVLASQISAEDGNSIDKMLIAFITFEFRCTTKSNDDDDDDEFSVDNLTTRICEYDCSKECTSSDIYHATLVGCFQR
ncbi:hypothetical protein M0R45_000692 [Rubus argutus]|uniref:Uncharacterized protein n=1 Tax=Rubus argutus TaxID=59490 RepID=A0AAW1VNM0_RUBAR